MQSNVIYVTFGLHNVKTAMPFTFLVERTCFMAEISTDVSSLAVVESLPLNQHGVGKTCIERA